MKRKRTLLHRYNLATLRPENSYKDGENPYASTLRDELRSLGPVSNDLASSNLLSRKIWHHHHNQFKIHEFELTNKVDSYSLSKHVHRYEEHPTLGDTLTEDDLKQAFKFQEKTNVEKPYELTLYTNLWNNKYLGLLNALKDSEYEEQQRAETHGEWFNDGGVDLFPQSINGTDWGKQYLHYIVDKKLWNMTFKTLPTTSIYMYDSKGNSVPYKVHPFQRRITKPSDGTQHGYQEVLFPNSLSLLKEPNEREPYFEVAPFEKGAHVLRVIHGEHIFQATVGQEYKLCGAAGSKDRDLFRLFFDPNFATGTYDPLTKTLTLSQANLSSGSSSSSSSNRNHNNNNNSRNHNHNHNSSTCNLNYRILCQIESHKDWLDHQQTDHAHFLLASLQFDQIELDITRTEETITSAETAALRRILRAFCLRNPRVGYCQAMNFVAISLLRAARTGSLSEEDAFWLLVAVCEEIVPYYYVKDMSGVKVATSVLTGLVSQRFPQLSEHLVQLQFPLELFSIPWICSLFSSSFPAETVYRIWDALFLNGADILFYVTMAFLRIHLVPLLSITNMMDANAYLKQKTETCYDVETLMELALEERTACSDEVAKLREHFYANGTNDEGGSALDHQQGPTTTTSAKDLVRSTPFQRSDIESLLGDLMFARHDATVGTTKEEGGSKRRHDNDDILLIEYNQKEFTQCLTRLLINLNKHDQRVHIWHSTAFEIFATRVDGGSHSGSVNLQSFACVLALFHRGTSVDERLKLCFSCFGKWCFVGRVGCLLSYSRFQA